MTRRLARPDPCLRLLLSGAVWVGAGAVRAAELPESADDPSAFVTVIEAEEFRDRFVTVEDVLQHQAGIRVRRYGGLGSYSTASIRGSKAEQLVVLLDGVRISSAQRGSVDLSTLSLENIERIEVLRGGGSARHGSGAMGGVISITSRRAQDSGVELGVSAGELRTLGADLALSHVGDRVRGAFGYSRLRSENEFEFELAPEDPGDLRSCGRKCRQGALDGGRHRRLGADFVRDDSALSVAMTTGATSEASLVLHLHRKDAGQPGSLLGRPTVDVSDEQLSCPHGEERYRRAVLRAAWREQAFRGGSLELAASHRYERSKLRDRAGACGYFPALVFSDGRTSAETRETQTGIDLAYVGLRQRIGPFYVSHRSATALRLERLSGEDGDTRRRWVGSLFAQQEIRVLGGRLRLVPALGLELARTSAGSARAAGFDQLIEVDVDDEPAWLPQLGLIVQLRPGLRLKSNLRRAYRRPDFSELFQEDYGFIRGNPTLEPERSRDFDVGLEFAEDGWGPLGDLRVEAVFFQREIDESIEWVLVNTSVTPLNTGPARARGWELSGSLTLGGRLDLIARYSALKTEIRSTGAPLPHAPERRFFGRAALRIASVRGWAELSYEGELFLNEGGRRRADAATQIDVGVTIEPDRLPLLGWLPRGLTLSAELANVTEERRVDSLGLPLPEQRLWLLRVRLAPR
ncbi:MAG: TonB-dependent receptor [Myxococcota bacterium]